ncbi:MAG: Eco57I restriction-modification methylase domain-containing protein [Synergistaceae bacterium]|nr:Eco57I restriction-modification methylase domain-containing protein [Synergistaceae bacterium]
MDEARLKIFCDTLENEYDSKRFLRFIIELINGVEIKSPDININADENFPGIEFYNDIGTYTDSNDETIALFSVCINTTLEARNIQRNFIRKLLENSNINGALAAFYTKDNPEKWRLSFVRLDYSFSMGKYNITITPAKRYSYLVGLGEPSHTAQKRLFPIFSGSGSRPSLDELEEAFSVEPVTEEFYRLYESKYFDLKESLDSDSKFTLNSEHFAKKLLGQIAFLYFLQKKGWLGVPHSQDWGTGRRDFMRQIFTQCANNEANFFNDYLEPLFYNALNNDRGNDSYFPELDCRIPFLNGGLFEANYDWHAKSFTIDNEFFSNIDSLGRDADGLLDIFDRYNFTISEDEPFESEIAIDPEMLGKVFENLLDRPERKKIGAFYTPREIVHYMCRECLIDYLTSRTKIDSQEIRKFITFGDILARDEIDSNILERLGEIDSLLANIKVVDPAAGSGAFLLGMLNEITHSREIISLFMNNNNRDSYSLKRDTIRDSIFACDIEPAAVDIAKLRLWLSLVIDNSDSTPRPLPNLDCNIICADSLLESFMGIKLTSETRNQGLIFGDNQDDRDMMNELTRLQNELYDESDIHKKESLRTRIQEIYDAIITRQIHLIQNTETQNIIDSYNMVKNEDSKPFLLWQMTFPRVFRDNNGFDIVIGNPPYINVEKISDRKTIYETFKTCVMRTDLYIAFIEKGCSLLANEGILSFIIPYSYTNQNYAQLSREMLINDYSIDEIVDTSNYFVFKRAVVKNIILRVSKSHNQGSTRIRTAETREDFEAGNFHEFTVNQEEFKQFNASRFRVNDFRNAITLKGKIDSESVKFGEICLCSYGARLNSKHDKSRTKKYYIHSKYEEGLKPFIEGKNIQRYHHEQSGWLKYSPDEHYNSMFPELFENEKIIFIRVVSERLRSSHDDKGLYNSHTVINCVRIDKLQKVSHPTAKKIYKLCKNFDFISQYDMKFLLAILNSKLISWYFMTFISDGIDFYPDDAKALPIIDLRKKRVNQEQIISLVNQLIESKSHNMTEDSQEIDSRLDRMIYELYGLSDSEIALIES